jgi:hypothetical protein
VRTVTYQSVLDRVAGLLQGVLAAEANGVRGLDSTDAAVAAGYVNRVTREYWERYAWPEWCVIERRTFRLAWSAQVYAAGAEVWYWPTRKYYQALRATTGADTPALLSSGQYSVNAAYWAEASESATASADGSQSADNWSSTTTYTQGQLAISPVDGEVYQLFAASSLNQEPSATLTSWGHRINFIRSLDLAQAGQTAISMVKRMWNIDPRVSDPLRLAGHEVAFEVYDGEVVARPGPAGADIVWVQFWKVCPTWAGDLFDASRQFYSPGAEVFYGTDYYVCVTTTSTGESPVSAPAKWVVVGYPRVLAEMVAWRVYGELCGKAGGAGANAGDGMAMDEEIFGGEVLKLEREQGQGRQLRVMTR